MLFHVLGECCAGLSDACSTTSTELRVLFD